MDDDLKRLADETAEIVRAEIRDQLGVFRSEIEAFAEDVTLKIQELQNQIRLLENR
ncbi:MAG TPA: hypothetical protein VGM51_09640 [Armatimonadota bacterium]|jgi:gas vesicle protein